jgi:streptogrisin C
VGDHRSTTIATVRVTTVREELLVTGEVTPRTRMTPFRITAVAALGALLAVSAAVPQTHAAAVSAATWNPAAVALADEWRVPIEEAAARIDRQAASAALADSARTAFGSRFGGAYLDQARGGVLVVGFVGSVPSDELGRLAERHGLRGKIVGTTVAHSQDRLEAAVASLSTGLTEANRHAEVPLQVALRLDLNAVELSQPATARLTDGQRRFIVDASARFGSLLAHERADSAPQVAACNFPNCDSPLRGGVNIHGCTAGFITQSKVDTKKYVLTAGHCVDDGGTKHTHLANLDEVDIGPVHNYTFGPGGDMGIIRILDTGYWDPKAWVYVTASNGGYPTTKNESYTISGTGYSSALIGEYLCKTGKTSGTTCGKVEAIGVTVNYSASGVTVHGLGRAKIHTCKGDSGGPLYVQHIAYGLVSGITLYPGDTQCGGTTYYQGVKGAADAMNVFLLTA